jgi:hypothetical protein
MLSSAINEVFSKNHKNDVEEGRNFQLNHRHLSLLLFSSYMDRMVMLKTYLYSQGVALS